MLILRELVCTPNIKMKDIAQRIGITIQAVSEYLIKMRDEGLVVSVGKGDYIGSNEGVHFLHASLIDLQEFVDQVSSDLTIVRRCTALSETTINRGEKVSLWMKEGRLHANKDSKSSSIGVALTEAQGGGAIVVGELEGILEMDAGKIVLIESPFPLTKFSSAAAINSLKNFHSQFKHDYVAVLDLFSLSLLKNADLSWSFEFGAITATLEAAQKGLTVFVVGTPEKANELIIQWRQLSLDPSKRPELEAYPLISAEKVEK